MSFTTSRIAKLALIAFSIGLFMTVDASAGDCEPYWDNALGQPGMDATINALAVYNGDLIAGGDFTHASGQLVNHIARWDAVAQSWQPFIANGAIGVNDRVQALTVFQGDLIVGGWLTEAGEQIVNGIARWSDATGQWQPFVSNGIIGGTGPVHALLPLDGDLIVGGFTTAGGVLLNRISRWDGSTWHPFIMNGFAGVDSSVLTLAEFQGALHVGGTFDLPIDGVLTNRIARWDFDASQWHQLTSGGQTGIGGWIVRALAVYDGELIVGGFFSTAGGHTVNHLARWDGATWHPFAANAGVGVSHPGMEVAFVHDDELYIGGNMPSAGGSTVNRIARWDPAAGEWLSLVSGGQVGANGNVRAMASYNGDLVVAGAFTMVGGNSAAAIATWRTACPAPKCVPADLNCDGIVGVADLLLLLAAWGTCDDCPDTPCPADLTGDCNVGVADLLFLLANWG